ncbi:MAG: porin family protein [Bacteroidia bacterium]|nr:porin family protein [Bacteroidia bacterium]
MRAFIVLLVFWGISFTVFSQDFKGGLLFGLVSSQLDGDTHAGYDKAGIHFGGFVSHPFSGKYSGQLELKYIQKGSYNDGKSQSDPLYYKSKINYIEMPVLCEYKFRKIVIEAGISAGYLIKATEDKDGYGDLPADPPFKKYEFSGIAGLNYLFAEKWKANFRFEYSIIPVRDNPGSLYFNGNQFNNVLSFAIYYQF